MNEHFQHLSNQLEGEIYTDQLLKSLYATDASVYREIPLAVAFPKEIEDIKHLIRFAKKHNLSLIPRSAGTSLAGQCVGNGIVVDVSKYMDKIVELNEQEKWVKVQPGVIRDELNTFLKPYGLFFAPNTSTANRCTIGGMVGNNSSGTTSIVYGDTRGRTLELKTILSDGTEAVFGEINNEIFEVKKKKNNLESSIYNHIDKILRDSKNQENIKKKFPKKEVTRRNTGYALDLLLDSEIFSENNSRFNFSNLLCGSEGTLAFTTEITLKLDLLPQPFDVVLAAHFTSISDSLKATVIAMNHKPTACELMDKTILDCTKDNIEQQKNRFFVQEDPEAILMIEFRGDTVEKATQKAEKLIEDFKKNQLGFAFPIVTGKDTEKVWDLRKAGLGLLANIPGDKKAVACIEDTAVAINDLPNYIEEFSEIMRKFNQKSVYYAHAGAGELHLRPILNLKTSEGVKEFRAISEASAKLVKKYRGSLSGEHGDGRVRAEFIPLVLGEKMYQLFRQIKQTWDANGIFNPGKIVDAAPMDTHLRYQPDVKTPEYKTIFNFDETGGILRTVEKCNGSGDCRKLNFAGGTMCPSYRATRNEKDTTRGRANILREFLTQNVKKNPFDHPEIKEVMDLCLSCKGCKSECPSNVDMATLKSEFQYQYYKSHSIPLRTWLIANTTKLNAFASKLYGISNFIMRQNSFKKLLGFAEKRSLPSLHKNTFKSWIKKHPQSSQNKKVYLFCDEYTNYYDVEIGKKAVLLLNKLGYQVLYVQHPESGRSYISKGLLRKAQQIAQKNVSIFSTIINKKTPLIGIEPSCILGFRDEYPKLVDTADKSKAVKLAENTFLIDEFLALEVEKGRIDQALFTSEKRKLVLHGHCHQKALSSIEKTAQILRLPKNYELSVIPSGCCGMAGSFGYEKEHYELSMKIGSQVLFPAINNTDDETLIVAAGTSCRHQIADGTQRNSLHPVEVLYEALK